MATKPSSSSSSDYVKWGNIYNVSVLSLSLLYAGCVIYDTTKNQKGDDSNGGSSILDDEWKKEGFCIANRDVKYWSSHETSFYVDVVFCVLIGYMYYCWKDRKGMEFANQFIPMGLLGTSGHGVAHWIIASKMREKDESGSGDEDFLTNETTRMQHVLFVSFFWFPLLKASISKASAFHIYILAIAVQYFQSKLHDRYGFTYIQTVLSIASHTSQLMLPLKEKQCRSYMMFPVLGALPAIVCAINEAMNCQLFYKALGGHVLFDASIVVGISLYYIDCYVHSTSSTISNDKKKP